MLLWTFTWSFSFKFPKLKLYHRETCFCAVCSNSCLKIGDLAKMQSHSLIIRHDNTKMKILIPLKLCIIKSNEEKTFYWIAKITNPINPKGTKIGGNVQHSLNKHHLIKNYWMNSESLKAQILEKGTYTTKLWSFEKPERKVTVAVR